MDQLVQDAQAVHHTLCRLGSQVEIAAWRHDQSPDLARRLTEAAAVIGAAGLLMCRAENLLTAIANRGTAEAAITDADLEVAGDPRA